MYKGTLSPLPIIIVMFFYTASASAQESPKFHDRNRLGVVTSFGGQALLDLEYRYLVSSIQVEYEHAIKKYRSWILHALVQTQYNITRFNYDDGGPVKLKGYEFGLNLGINMEKTFNDGKMGIYMGVGTGPHFISDGTHRQADGILFCNNIYAGFKCKLNGHLELDIRPGFRHISNAGLWEPNGGINNSMLGIGLFHLF